MLYASAVTQAPYSKAAGWYSVICGLLMLLWLPLSAQAADSVGKVILSIGQNVATGTDGTERKLSRKAEVFADDILKTGAKGRLQIRFSDGSRLSLRADSEFEIAEYRFDASEPAEGKAIYKLLKGGMRTLSGQIGKVDREDYRLETTVATIGIRGTDFVVINNGDSVTGQVNSGAISVDGTDGLRSEVIETGSSFNIQLSGPIQVFETPADTATGEGTAADSTTSEEESEEASEDSAEQSSEGTGEDQSGEESAENTQTSSDTSDSGDASGGDATAGSDGDTGSSAAGGESAGNLVSDITAAAAAISAQNLPATDPQVVSDAVDLITAPNPTGNGSLAPDGSVVAVTFNESVAGVLRSANGAVLANGTSLITVDNSTAAGDVVTGIQFVDTGSSGSSAPCSPCTFTGPSSLGRLTESGTLSIGGANVTWGRWNSGFTVVENGSQLVTNGSFGFMYSDSLTTAAELATVATARSGEYVYAFGASSTKLIAPQVENGNTGVLIDYNNSSVPAAAGQTFSGTYVLIDWDTQKITEASIVSQVDAGGGARLYQLQDTGQTSLSSVLNGGQLSLTGSCSGADCGGNTALGGQLTFDLIGNQADAAVTSYGATGTLPDGTNTTLTGTVLLENSGPAVVPE